MLGNLLPGRPQSRLQAVTTACWDGKQIIAYVSGNAIVVLDGPNNILQTHYTDLPDELVAIVLDEISGKIAACSASEVHIYKPLDRSPQSPTWSFQCRLPAAGNHHITALTWGMDEELLVAGSSLSLFSTHSGADVVWTKPLASPAKIAHFSYDTSLIATTGLYDRMVKIWRRLSLADQRFEFDYLPHPSVVTGLCWRRPFHRDQSFDNVLYTTCADNKLRIWYPGDPQSYGILQLWGDIDLMDSIQPRSLQDRSYQRYAFIIHSRDFTLATEKAVQHASSGEERDHLALLHLIEVAHRSPEICVVLDERGNMSAWGIESVGSRYRMPGDIFNVAHVDGLRLRFNTECPAPEDNVQFFPFCGEPDTKPFSVLVHHFDGRIEWLEGKLDHFFDPSPRADRLTLKASWTGHSSEIRKVVRSASGRAMISRTKDDESLVWIQRNSSKGTEIQRACVLDTREHIHRVWLLQDGRFVVFLHYDSISLWDARGTRAVEVARRPYAIQGKPLCLLHIPEEQETENACHIATISSEMKGISWEISLPHAASTETKATLEQFDHFDLGSGDGLSFVLSVDPAGKPPVISGFLDIFARDIAISYTNEGKLTSWTARPNLARRKLEWLVTSSIDTGIEHPYLASGTSIRKAALVSSDQTQLTIWGTKHGTLQHEERFTNGEGVIQDLDWCSTPDNQSILAVGFPHRVIIYGQLRFDYLDSRPSWAPLREINILQYTTHSIGDSVWLGGGSFAVGAGNQLIVFDDRMPILDAYQPDLRVSAREKSGLDIFTVVRRLNGPLPLYHPQYLAQFILGGKILLVQRILLRLWKMLKFHSDGDAFDSMLEFSIRDISNAEDAPVGAVRKDRRVSYDEFVEQDPESVTEEVASSLNELLTTREVPLLSSREQFHLADAVECIGTVEKHRRSLDENGCRFLLFFRQHSLRESQHVADQAAMSWREITWAFHSNSQDILADLVSRHYHGRMLWQHARESGLFMWLTDLTALRSQFEIIARNEFTKSERRNPVDSSVFYLALRKKTILAGLWRTAMGHAEQAATQRFLSNNFNEGRWKTAALKNAYTLMGKRRFTAFFLLADHLKDAVSVLSHQLNDDQLAIVVARVYEGDNGPVLHEFLTEKILPQATADGNRWMATWALWMLGKRDSAVRALVLPLSEVLSPPTTPKLDSKHVLTDDPALVVLYKQLRERSLQTLRGAISISPRAEWDFVMHIARVYTRMGCDFLALDLVRTWNFITPLPAAPKRPLTPTTALPTRLRGLSPTLLHAFDVDPRGLMRRRSSLVVDDLPPEIRAHARLEDSAVIGEEEDGVEPNGVGGGGASTEEKAPESPVEAKKKPTQFQEPTANSLLDSFGF